MGPRQTIGRFAVRDFLGRGAIGDVLLAWDSREERLVALKVVRTAKTDPEMLQAEKNGLSLQAQLAAVAPQVAAVYEQGEDAEFFWVAMEYVDGTDLSELLARGRLPEPRAIGIALELVSMLEVCHEFSAEVGGRRIAGIVHGDIKPENIRLQSHDRVRVLDFGIAKHLSHTRRFTVNLFGSLPYTPPERLERGVVDRHSDLWAVGVVLAAMVSGRRPFPGNTPEELEQAIRHGVPPLPLPDGCSAGLAYIVDRSLAFEVHRRYQTAAELEADLLALRDGQPLPSAAPAAGAATDGADASNGAAGEADLHATRRTIRPLAADELRAVEATRRTTEVGIPTGPLPAAVPAPPPPRRRHGLRRATLALAAVFALAFAGTQLWAWNQAKELRRALAEEHPDLDAIADRYGKVASWSMFSTDLYGVGDELLRALRAAAERILDSYHGDDPTTTPRGWQAAYRSLQSAARLAPRDHAIRARLLYARAHLDRIDAINLRGQGDRKRAQDAIKEAIGNFQEAARWDPAWPDPYLGLARIYAYDQFDLDGLQKTVAELGRRGYRIGRRETAMLADAFRMHGLALEARAQRAHGAAAIELLKQARDDLQQAVRFYGDISGFAYAATNRAEAASHLRAIEERLMFARPPGFWEQLGRALSRQLRKVGGSGG
jgi:serine/threonine-protein kinase